MRVAVLSKEYVPLMYCDVRRAIILVYLKKAEIIRVTDQFMRSVTSVFPVPAVIRLLSKLARHFMPKITYTRRNIHMRDNFTCQYCGKNEQRLTLDHVHPVSRGGKSCWENVVSACHHCNVRKGNRTPEEAGMALLKVPKKPSILIALDWNRLFGTS